MLLVLDGENGPPLDAAPSNTSEPEVAAPKPRKRPWAGAGGRASCRTRLPGQPLTDERLAWGDGGTQAEAAMLQIPDHAPAFVSVENQFPEDLYDAMREFVRVHPQWDQYRLMQAALAGFLFQHGCPDRAVARHYLDGLFRRQEPDHTATRP